MAEGKKFIRDSIHGNLPIYEFELAIKWVSINILISAVVLLVVNLMEQKNRG